MNRPPVRRGALLALACLLGARTLDAQAPQLVERASVTSEGVEATLGSLGAAISADGSVVAFGSVADNLVEQDRNGKSDVFTHDRAAGTTTRVSVASDGTEADLWSYNPALSGDGRLVVFESDATNLVRGDTNGFIDIFVHDRDTGRTWRVSVDSHGVQADLPSFEPAISADGSTVAFQSYSTSLAGGGPLGVQHIYAHALATGGTTRVSVTSGGLAANKSSWSASLSGDGRFVAFSSQATNLAPGDFNGSHDVFVHDRVLGTTRVVSVSSAGALGSGPSEGPSLSGSGRYVAFTSWAKNLVPGDTNNHTDAFVHDRVSGRTVRASVSTHGAQGDSHSGRPKLSWDGRYAIFHSHASTLVEGDTNAQQDVFLRDLRSARTRRVSVSVRGEQGNALSLLPSATADGLTIAFESHAQNLVPDDTNAEGDVFVVTMD